MAQSVPLSIWVAAAVGVAGVSLAAITGDRQGSAARAESPAISPETIAAMNAVQEDHAVARARKSLTLFRQKDEGYALARVIARNMILELMTEMAARHQQGRKISGSWLNSKLALKKYQRVTFTDLFETWAKRTAEKLDAVQ